MKEGNMMSYEMYEDGNDGKDNQNRTIGKA